MPHNRRIITTTEDLKDLCTKLAKEPYITVDTEFHRERTYYPQLCLIQIAGQEDVAAIDPLAKDIDLSPLKKILFKRKPIKVMHACRQDMEIFLNIFDKLPAPLFDTQIAAMVLGHGDQVSYEKLVHFYTGGILDKGSRFSDWLNRPLTDRQIDYALSDVTYLRDIYEKQLAELKARKRLKWVEEEMEYLLEIPTYNLDPETSWERIKLRSRKPETLAVAKSLAAWRELKAQTKDQPRGRIMHDNVLAAIAAQPPKSADELAQQRGITHDLAHSPRGQQILDAVAEGLANKKAKKLVPDKIKTPSKRAASIAEILRLVLKIKCNEHDVVPRLVASNEDILALAEDDKAKVRARKGWRYEVFGQYAIDVKHGRLVIGVDADGNANLIER